MKREVLLRILEKSFDSARSDLKFSRFTLTMVEFLERIEFWFGAYLDDELELESIDKEESERRYDDG